MKPIIPSPSRLLSAVEFNERQEAFEKRGWELFGREQWERMSRHAENVPLTYAEGCTYLLDPNGQYIAWHHAVRAAMGLEP